MVTPGFIAVAVMSSTSRASLHTLRILSWPSASRMSHFDLLKSISRFGMPVSAQSGCLIVLGTGRRGESGYTGLTEPVYGNAGKGSQVLSAVSCLEDEVMVGLVPGRGRYHPVFCASPCAWSEFNNVSLPIRRDACADRTYPISLKAVLRAEVTVPDVLLQTCWALQHSSFILAISPRALLLRHCCVGLTLDL